MGNFNDFFLSTFMVVCRQNVDTVKCFPCYNKNVFEETNVIDTKNSILINFNILTFRNQILATTNHSITAEITS